MIFGLGGRIAAFLAVLLLITGWVAKHYMIAAHDAQAAVEQAQANLASLQRQHVTQIKTLEDEHADEVGRLRLEASVFAAIAAADAYSGGEGETTPSVAGKPVGTQPVRGGEACAGSPVMLALFDGLRSAAGKAGSSADPRRTASVRPRAGYPTGRRAASGPAGRRAVPR